MTPEEWDARRARIQDVYLAEERDPYNLWIKAWNRAEFHRAAVESKRG